MNPPQNQRTPQKPASLDPLASDILVALAKEPAATEIVLGGYFLLRGLELRRPLEQIPAGVERQRAETLRGWFKDTFLGI